MSRTTAPRRSRDPKIVIGAPCVMTEVNAKGEEKLTAPDVWCSYNNCENCGWNPAEQKRRMTEGWFGVYEKGERTLHFKRREKTEHL